MSTLLLLKNEPGTGSGTRTDERSDADPDGAGIRCPRCAWEPQREDRWSCLCGHVWNTFETRGVCPGCGHAWLETQCLRCHQWSRHEDWYVRERP